MKNLTLADVRAAEVPAGAVTIWWLGQGGFLLVSPGGTTAVVDPYLSNSCKAPAAAEGLDCDRMQPVPIVPGELAGVDLYALTHSHDDHLDPETLEGYRKAGGAGPYLAPAETVQKLLALGVPEEQIIMTWPNKAHTVGDMTVRATFAIPFCEDDLTHVGYLIRIESGPTVYITGDTAYEEILPASVAPHRPDVILAVINGLFRNMGPAQAARLAKEIDPTVIVPCHYGMFRCNTTSPDQLRTALHILDIEEKYRAVECGQAYTFPER